ncbi:MAG: hypothetical protein WCK54_04165 [Desulfuromonadales bacterium]
MASTCKPVLKVNPPVLIVSTTIATHGIALSRSFAVTTRQARL